MRARLTVALLLVVGATAVAACEDPDTEEAREMRDVVVEVCEPGHGLSGDLVRIAGTITNHSSKRSDYDIELRVLDGDVQVDTTSTDVGSVEPGGKAAFEAFGEAETATPTCELVTVDRWEDL